MKPVNHENRDPALERKLVILNQAANYLTVGFANAFSKRFESVTLVTGGVHVQGESLSENVQVHKIAKWRERPTWKKAMSYAFGLLTMWCLLLTKYRRHEVIFVSVPPMGYLLNLFVRNRFSMVIWDIYPDMLRLTGMQPSHPIYRFWAMLNRLSFRKAYRLYTISEALAAALSKYVDRTKIITHSIWAIGERFERIEKTDNYFIEEQGLKGKYVVQYSGNIGFSQNLDVLLDVASLLKGNQNIVFQIIGRGTREAHLRSLVRERNLKNVQILPFQSDSRFPFSLSAADLGVVILHESVSRGSVPSKTYNLMKFGIPSLYIAAQDSELARYARELKNAECFVAKQTAEMAAFIEGMASDQKSQKAMGERALTAAEFFHRRNAEKFVESYFSP